MIPERYLPHPIQPSHINLSNTFDMIILKTNEILQVL